MDEQIKEVPIETIKTEEVKVEDKTTDEVLKKMNDMLDLNEISELINSNEKVFELKGITYRIKKPNYNQKQEVYKKRIEKYIEMLKDEKCLLEKDLKELYKKRGIDTDEMQRNMNSKMKKRDEFMVQLGGEIKRNTSDPALKELKKEIDDINLQIQVLSIEKSSLLEFSLEQQLLIYVYTYFVFILAEKKEGDNWIKVWKDWDEFMNSDQELINRFSYYVTVIIGNEGL